MSKTIKVTVSVLVLFFALSLLAVNALAVTPGVWHPAAEIRGEPDVPAGDATFPGTKYYFTQDLIVNRKIGIGTDTPSSNVGLDVRNSEPVGNRGQIIADTYLWRNVTANAAVPGDTAAWIDHYDGNLIINQMNAVTGKGIMFNIPGGPGGETRMFIRSDGNVGIGTTPASGYKLDVKGNVRLGDPSGASYVEIADINTAEWRISTGGYDLSFQNDYDDNGTYDTRLIITEDGEVGIGTTPSYRLHVAGGAYGIYASGSTMGGRFSDSNNSGYAYLGYGDYGVKGYGDTAGGYFYDRNDFGYAYVGYADWGLYTPKTSYMSGGALGGTSNFFVVYRDLGDVDNLQRQTFCMEKRAGINQTNYAPCGASKWWTMGVFGYIRPAYSETYTFYVSTDDGAALFINGSRCLMSWKSQGCTEYTCTKYLTANKWYPLYLEHYQGGSDECLKLEWSSASQSRQVISGSRIAYPALWGFGYPGGPP